MKSDPKDKKLDDVVREAIKIISSAPDISAEQLARVVANMPKEMLKELADLYQSL